MTVALIDYGAGNVPSVERALQRLDAPSRRVTLPEELESATAIILPGVGHFAAIVRALDKRRLRPALLAALARGVPFLGICLGLQVLFAHSEEAPTLHGLGVYAGTVKSLPMTAKLPHMGWNRVRILRPCALLDGLSDDPFFYFAHTFAVDSTDDAVALCHYGTPFTAVLQRDNIFATQFHPEKSGPTGARLLQNFVRLAS